MAFCRSPCSVSISMMLLKRSAPVVWFAVYLYSALVFFVMLTTYCYLLRLFNRYKLYLHLCEAELIYLDACINNKKSVCIRFGSRFDVK